SVAGVKACCHPPRPSTRRPFTKSSQPCAGHLAEAVSRAGPARPGRRGARPRTAGPDALGRDHQLGSMHGPCHAAVECGATTAPRRVATTRSEVREHETHGRAPRGQASLGGAPAARHHLLARSLRGPRLERRSSASVTNRADESLPAAAFAVSPKSRPNEP